jgi:hypothetical protein
MSLNTIQGKGIAAASGATVGTLANRILASPVLLISR